MDKAMEKALQKSLKKVAISRSTKSTPVDRDAPAPQARKRRNRNEFFDLQRQIATDLWSEDQRTIFLNMCNEVDLDDLHNREKEIVTFEMMFAGNNAERDMKLPHYLGQLKAFEIFPKDISLKQLGPRANSAGETAGLINGEAMNLMHQGDSLLMKRQYDAALLKYFEAIRLVPYKKSCFYNSCAACYANLGHNELVQLNSLMAATIDETYLDAWIHLASSSIRIMETHGLMNINHRVGVKQKEIAGRLAQVAYKAITPLYAELIKQKEAGTRGKKSAIHDIVTLKALLESLEEKNMTGALDDMHLFLK